MGKQRSEPRELLQVLAARQIGTEVVMSTVVERLFCDDAFSLAREPSGLSIQGLPQ